MGKPRKVYSSPEGTIEREMTDEEIEFGLQMGDHDVLKYIAREELKEAKDLVEKVAVLIKFLQLDD